MPQDLILCAVCICLQDATAEPVLAGPRTYNSLSIAAPDDGWGILSPGLHSDPGFCCLWKVSSPPPFPSAPQTELALRPPRPGECGSELDLEHERGRNCEVPGIGLRELVTGVCWGLGRQHDIIP